MRQCERRARRRGGEEEMSTGGGSLLLTVPLTLISITGLIVNVYILTVVLLTKQAACANNLLLLHLGTIDTLLGVLFLTFSVPGLIKTGGWLSNGGVPCVVHGFLFTLLHPLVLWTVCGLNCDRYYAIAAPLHYGHLVNQKKVMAGLGVGWLISVALCVPPLFAIAPYTYSPGLGACVPDFTGYGSLWYTALYTALTLLLPATLIICCNMKILMIARYHRHRIASAIYEVALSAQVTITHQRNPFFVPAVTAPPSAAATAYAVHNSKLRGRNAAVPTVLQLLISIVLLYLPYYAIIVWEASANALLRATASSPSSSATSSPKINHHVYAMASTLLTCSPPVNGFLYGVKNKTLRKTFRNYWRKKLTKSELNQEIQARTPSTCGGGNSRRPSLTPLGFLCRPATALMMQRRLSETVLDVNKRRASNSSPTHRSKMKRIASEMTWRPHNDSFTGLDLSSADEEDYAKRRTRRQVSSSCNTLRVPSSQEEYLDDDDDEESESIRESACVEEKFLNKSTSTPQARPKSGPNVFLHRILFGASKTKNRDPGAECDEDRAANDQSTTTTRVGHQRSSPRILVTRAFSEDDKEQSVAVTGDGGAVGKRKKPSSSSSATTLLLLDANNATSSRSSDDSSTSSSSSSSVDDASDLSNGRLYFNLDTKGREDEEEEEEEEEKESNRAGAEDDQLLLITWPESDTTRGTRESDDAFRSVDENPLLHVHVP